jgi:hypothetical protein
MASMSMIEAGGRKGPRLRALDLAAQFRDRAEQRGGALWLSVKQVAFLKSLATPVWSGYRGDPGPVVAETVHGRLQVHAYFEDGTVWTCHVQPSGAGLFKEGL